MFTIIVITAALSGQLKSTGRLTLIITAVCSVLSGNIFPFLIFIFLESPFLFLSLVFINILAYVSAYVLDISVGYILNGSIIEMIIYFNNGVYLISVGVVFICIGYFVAKYVAEKHGISDCLNIYIPKKLRKLVENLGGIKNLIRFKDECLEVRNPKLVNTLELECEIKENIVSSRDENFMQLQDYV